MAGEKKKTKKGGAQCLNSFEMFPFLCRKSFLRSFTNQALDFQGSHIYY